MSLDDRANVVQREMFLRVVGLARLPVAVARALAQTSSDVYFEPGATIFERGDHPDGVYFVVDGDVTLEAPGEEPWVFGRGAVVGVLDVNIERPRARTAVAQTTVHALFVQAEDFLEVLEDNFEFAIGSRTAVAAALHPFVIDLAPSGGFDEPEPHDDFDVVPEMNAIAKLVVLRSTKVFSSASVQALASLAVVAENIELGAGEMLFEAGGDPDIVYVVGWGMVEIVRSQEPVVRARFGPSDLVGGMATFGGTLVDYAARAIVPSMVLRIAVADLDDVAEDHYDVTRSITQANAIERERLMTLAARARPSIAPVSGTSKLGESGE